MNAALAGLVIVAIGDSQMMNMLSNLHNQLENAGAVVYSYAVCGSTAADWISPSVTSCGTGEHQDKSPVVFDQKPHPGWNINDLIARHHPNLIIVELGDTMAGYGSQMEIPWIHDQITGLTGRIAANKVSCVWVGPPWGSEGGASNKTFARVQDLSGYLSQIVYPCRYVDSLRFSQPGQWATFDGEHLTPDSYRLWGADIADATVRLSGQILSH